MDVATIDVVLGCVVTKQSQVNKIGGARQKLEGSEISLVERGRVGPNPTDAILFQQTDKLRPMPPGMSKFDCKSEIPRQLHKKFAQCLFAIIRSQRRRELNEDHLELLSKWFDGAEKGIQLSCAIAQTADVGDLPGKLAGKPKTSGSRFGPTTNAVFRRSSVKRRVHFNGGEILGIKLQPM